MCLTPRTSTLMKNDSEGLRQSGPCIDSNIFSLALTTAFRTPGKLQSGISKAKQPSPSKSLRRWSGKKTTAVSSFRRVLGPPVSFTTCIRNGCCEVLPLTLVGLFVSAHTTATFSWEVHCLTRATTLSKSFSFWCLDGMQPLESERIPRGPNCVPVSLNQASQILQSSSLGKFSASIVSARVVDAVLGARPAMQLTRIPNPKK